MVNGKHIAALLVSFLFALIVVLVVLKPSSYIPHIMDPIRIVCDRIPCQMSVVNMEEMEMGNPNLIYIIRKFFLESPSKIPYKLDKPNETHYSQHHQSQFVADYFKQKRNGTYVEAGAYTGESLSNSLYFEKSLGWSGVLIEPVLSNQLLLRAKNRKSFFLPGCLAERYPRRARFSCSSVSPGCQLISNVTATDPHLSTDVWCFSLYSVLLAANMTRVDYLVLDLEGFEIFVLEAIPFDKLNVKLVQIESAIPGSAALDPVRSNKFRVFFQTNWPQFREVDFNNGSKIDLLFENVLLPL